MAAIALVTAIALAAPAPACAATDLAGARALLLTGRYTEAQAAYAALAGRDSVAAAIGVARCHAAVGEIGPAIEALRRAAARHPGSPELQVELAVLELQRGGQPAARAHVDRALALDPDRPAAHYLLAELDRLAGKLDQANEGYRWLVRYYNREQDQIRDPEVLRWIGLGGVQFARWNRNSSQFHFMVNTLYPDAKNLDPLYWPAHLEAALLFIEKYNRVTAAAELDSILAINPRAAEAHAARGWIALQQFDLDSARASIDRALAIHPRLVMAHRLGADLALVASGPRHALPLLEKARGLDPTDEETLGRLAAVLGAIDGLRDDPAGTRMGAVIDEAVARNAHCGAFFASLAATLDLLRKYPDAARYYEEARRRMPQLVAVPGQLGMVALRLGEEDRARAILKEAFEADPFNVRVKNSLDVLALLNGYGTVETRHFVIRFDRAQDSLFARYASRYLEDEVYPEIVQALGYEPAGKSLFEVFASHDGTSGHGWFSRRMVGLPFIGTVGACAGKMVAITSPSDGRRFNWARVLKHEFVHVINLQQTRFNISHWFTEALAVRLEGPGHPADWDLALSRRARAGKLFDLSNINMGFARPDSHEDWMLAYYQSLLYAQYMADRYGKDALAKMLAAYTDNLDTPGALKKSFGVDVAAFEKGYREYVDKIVTGASSPEPPAAAASETVAQLEVLARERPGDAAVKARLALAVLREATPYRARSLALEALAIDPKQQVAAFVQASVFLLEGNKTEALAALRGAFDERTPNADALGLMARLTLEAKDYAAAEKLSLLGQERFPGTADWDGMLASCYRKTAQNDKLIVALETKAARDADDLDIRMELARFATERKDFAAAGRWALDALHIDVNHALAHATRAKALAETGNQDGAIEEYETAIALSPESEAWRDEVAKVYTAAGRKNPRSPARRP